MKSEAIGSPHEEKLEKKLQRVRALEVSNPTLARTRLEALYRETAEYDHLHAKTCTSLAYVHALLGRFEECDPYLKEALTIRRRMRDNPGMGKVYGTTAAILAIQGRPERALQQYVKALRLTPEIGGARAAMIAGVGASLYSLGRYGESTEYQLAAIEMYESLHLPVPVTCYGILSSIYLEIKDRPRALAALKRAEKVARKTNDTGGLLNIELSYVKLGSSTTGKASSGIRAKDLLRIRKVRTSALRIGLPTTAGLAYNFESDALAELGKHALALERVAQGIEIFTRLGDEVRLQASYARQGDILVALGRTAEALRAYKNALSFNTLHVALRPELLSKIGNCLASSGKYEQAYRHVQQGLQTASDESAKELRRTLLVERELMKLRKQRVELDTLKASDANTKHALLTALAQVEGNKRSQVQSEEKGGSHANGDSSQVRVMEQLAERYPSLSMTELRTCYLLRLSLSSKEIANVLGCSVRTVEWHRANIRTKLGLYRTSALTREVLTLDAGDSMEAGTRRARATAK
jgi:tetratricopeptide (TPR) repeat protein